MFGSNKKIKTKKINCSPKPKYELNEFSCYFLSSILPWIGYATDGIPYVRS